MNIAVIGSGVAGLTAAYRLSERHDVTLFEAADYPGGHVNTIKVQLAGERHAIDTGFIVFNDRTYPNFIRLLDELGVASQPTDMSFSVRCDRSNLEYNGSSLNGVFAQRWNLLRPSFHRMLRDIFRFNRETPDLTLPPDDETTVGEFLRAGRYSREFAEHYLLPMGSAVWSCPRGMFEQCPIRFIFEFYRHHGLLSLHDRPQWRVIQGGSRTYVDALLARFRGRMILNSPITKVRREPEGTGVQVVPRDGTTQRFDHVVVACHADQALRMLADPSPIETELLSAFPYERNLAVLHTDESVLPRSRRAWACWNYRLPTKTGGGVLGDRATVTYDMNLLQGISSQHTFCVTLNDDASIDPAKVLRHIEYHHPLFSTRKASAQARHAEVLNIRNTSFCGAYWGSGFHEDGVVSAQRVVRALELAASPSPAVTLTAGS